MKWVTGEAVLVTNRFKTCSRISPLIGSCICKKQANKVCHIFAMFGARFMWGKQGEKHRLTTTLYLEALKKNLPTKSTRLLVWRFSGGRSFCDLPKWSSFRPK